MVSALDVKELNAQIIRSAETAILTLNTDGVLTSPPSLHSRR